MLFIVAPDSFKGSLSAVEAANAMAEGIKNVFPNSIVKKIPLADGGEGTVEALVAATQGKIIKVKVQDPLGRKIDSFIGILGNQKTAVVEMAAASGITLLKEKEKNPLITSTFGTGELIKKALDLGCEEIIIGIGGSATNDGGAAMAQALGVRFLDKNNKELPLGGKYLKNLAFIDTSQIDKRLEKVKVIAACDVDNPLCGIRGASAVYGPQKGATQDNVMELDTALKHYAMVIKEQMGKDVLNIPGAGAAGGLGAGILTFLNGKLSPGIQLILNAVNFEDQIKDADLILTGEGKIDEQTAYGKAPMGVAQAARKYDIPVFIFGGILSDNYHKLYEIGVDYISANVQKIINLEEAISNAYELLTDNVERAMRGLKVGIQIGKVHRWKS
jgi:glycerate kinase